MKESYSRHLKVIWAFLEILCFGGLEMGWGSLIYVLKDEGLYADLCRDQANSTGPSLGPNSTFDGAPNVTDISTKCSAQDLRLNLFYTVGTGCGIVFHLAGGQIFSRLGTRTVRCIYICFFWAGCLMIAFTSRDLPWLICPGVLFVTGGSLVFLLTTTQLSNQYSRGSTIVIGLMNGTMDSSSAIQLLIKLAHQAGFQRKHSYFIIIAASVTTLISTFTIFPKTYIYKATEKVQQRRERDNKPSTQSEALPDQLPGRSVMFRKYVCNPIFIPHILWFGVLMLHFNYFIATINSYLNYVTNNDKGQVSHFTNVLSYTMFCGLASSFMAGMMYDWQKQKYKDSASVTTRKIMPAIVPMLVATGLQLLLSVCQMVPHTWILYPAFVVFTSFRSFLFSVSVSFLADVFPTNIFGILYTVMLTQSSIMHFVQYGMFEWVELYQGAIWHVHSVLLLLSLLTFAHPAVLWIQCRRHTHMVSDNGKHYVRQKSRYFGVLYDGSVAKDTPMNIATITEKM